MKFILSIILTAFIFNGCVNTDYINDPFTQPVKGRLTIQNSQQSVLINTTLKLSVLAFDPSGVQLNNVLIVYHSSNESVITTNNEGVVAGISEGQSVITVSAEGFESDSQIITVIQDLEHLSSISVSPSSASLKIGDQIQFTAKGLNGNGQKIDGLDFQWSSTDESVVVINENGVAEALNSGSATIYVSSGGIKSNNVNITVVNNNNEKSGSFKNNPSTSYSVSGDVTISFGNNQIIVEFAENFNTSNGPGLHVFISKGPTIGQGGLDLGSLKSTSGSQSYTLNSTDSSFTHIIIHCLPFNVTFGYAELK